MDNPSLNPVKIALPPLNRVPGIVERAPTKDRQGYIEHLDKLTKTELLEMRDREKKLLANKSRLDKLPDKGARIKEFYEKIEKQLKSMDDMDMAAEMFSELNIASVGVKAMNKMEWMGKYTKNEEVKLDSDDDEDEENIDPLKIIANSHDTEKVVKVIKPEPNLITEQDLKDIKKFSIENKSVRSETLEDAAQMESNDLEPHANYLCHKEVLNPGKEKFMPYKTTKSRVHDPENEKERGKHHHWENSSATPPTIVHGAAKCLSLEDSLHVLMEKNEVLKKAQEEHAMDRLNKRLKIKDTIDKEMSMEKKIHGPLFEGYREHDNEDGEEEDDIYMAESDNDE